MINIANDRLERLKQNLLKLNNKKHKKRVGETRVHLTQYVAHVLPLATQRFLLAPIYRCCVAHQGGNLDMYSALRLSNPAPFNILGGLYDSIGFRKLWSLSRVHVLSGAIFPGVLICTRSLASQSVYPRATGSFGNGYFRTVLLCNFAHLFSYPFDVAYGRFASTLQTEVSLRKYLFDTVGKHGEFPIIV
ncbi:pyridoxal-phosphate dependent enzyme [Babesia caballi]|uniref:Pyridoxal-phosphate dependent enzyme n=1 Tax=Babesia caballi TaxID=5871 RepID=A0AAV4M2L3_BABCB|nr:pyridoxal-phosphate dependent enzyme [Babesia caballi]